MNAHLRLKRFAIWFATVLMLIAIVAYLIAITVSDLNIERKTALDIAIYSGITIFVCMIFFLTIGARWDEELKKYETELANGALE
jgi:steroid 5-alpha reductase family enzyme